MYGDLSLKLVKILGRGSGTEFFSEIMNLIRGENAVLGYLYKFKNGSTITELQEIARVGSGRISDMINQLVSKKLVIKEKDIKDKRKMLVYLTQKGNDYIIDEHSKILEKLTDSLNKLSIDEADNFVNYIKKLVEVTDDETK